MVSAIDRRKHQCHRDGCDSEATFQACIAFWCEGDGKPRHQMKCTTTIQVCERHQKAVEPYLLSDRNKSAIHVAVVNENLAPPNFDTAEIVFVPVRNGGPVMEFGNA